MSTSATEAVRMRRLHLATTSIRSRMKTTSRNMANMIGQAKVLMVGAGGIGCELLKNLLLSGFGETHIVDLDTIDLSNLNRQFLFRHEHIKKSKALVRHHLHLNIRSDIALTIRRLRRKSPKSSTQTSSSKPTTPTSKMHNST